MSAVAGVSREKIRLDKAPTASPWMWLSARRAAAVEAVLRAKMNSPYNGPVRANRASSASPKDSAAAFAASSCALSWATLVAKTELGLSES